jgi:hypothetical protein
MKFLNHTTVWKVTSLVLAIIAITTYGMPVKVDQQQMETENSPLQIVKPVLAEEIYPKFTCPCCDQPLRKEDPCCGGMTQIVNYIDQQVDSGLPEDEIVMSTVKEFGIDRLTEEADQEAIKEQLAAAAPADAPKLEILETERDLGEISQAQGVVSTDFEFSNQGQTALVINKLSSSCGCTSAAEIPLFYEFIMTPRFTVILPAQLPGRQVCFPTIQWNLRSR